MDQLWDGDNLNTLIEKTGSSLQQVAKQCNVSYSTIQHWTRNKSAPDANQLIKLANLFAVPIDFICGRCDIKTANDILANYTSTYEKVRRSEYEGILARKKEITNFPVGYETPWPYNLLDDIFQEPTDHVLTEDEENGLLGAIRTLAERERKCLAYYYEDELSLREIAKIFNVTPERIRQIIRKAIRRLRHPSRLRIIKFGLQGANVVDSYKQKLSELNKREQDLTAREEYVNTYLNPPETIKTNALKYNDEVKYEKFPWGGVCRQPSEAFMCLELSVRSYNALLRANCSSVAEIIEHIRKGDLMNLRNLGKKSVSEIIKKVSENVGYDCYDIWGTDAEDSSKIISAEELKKA